MPIDLRRARLDESYRKQLSSNVSPLLELERQIPGETQKSKRRSLERQLQDQLVQIRNVVDANLELDEQPVLQKVECEVERPFFCIGGCDTVGSNSVLTFRGRQLLDRLRDYFVDKIDPQDNYDVTSPSCVPVEDYHAMRGCIGEGCLACGRTVVDAAPFWMPLLQQSAKYFDKQLPKVALYHERGGSWEDETLQVVAIVGPSLSADSRPFQQQWMQRLQTLYQALAPTATLALRTVSSLAFHESSRIELVSKLGSETVVLASLSNLQDYASVYLKHGSSKGRPHVLIGKVCTWKTTMDWMLQFAALDDNIVLPRALGGTEEIPYIRRIVRAARGGRKRVEALPQPPNDRITADLPLQPTPDHIRHEALSSPFDFLPFYS